MVKRERFGESKYSFDSFDREGNIFEITNENAVWDQHDYYVFKNKEVALLFELIWGC